MESKELNLLKFSKDLKRLAFLSYNIKRLRKGEKLFVVFPEGFGEKLKRWCLETGNKLLELERNRAIVERGGGFHGVRLGEKLGFYTDGVKLHAVEFLLRLRGKYPPYLVNFVSLNEGRRAVLLLKTLGVRCKLLPAPKEFEGYCGYALGFYDEKEALGVFEELYKNAIGVESIYKKIPNGFERLISLWELED